MKFKFNILSMFFLLLNSFCFSASKIELEPISPIYMGTDLLYIDVSLNEIEQIKKTEGKEEKEIGEKEAKVLTELQKIGSKTNAKETISGIMPIELSGIIMSYLEGSPSKFKSEIQITKEETEDKIIGQLNFKNYKILLDSNRRALVFNCKNGQIVSTVFSHLRIVLPNGNIAKIRENGALKIFSDRDEKITLINNLEFSKIEQLASGNLLIYKVIPTKILKVAQNWAKATLFNFSILTNCALELEDELIAMGTAKGEIIIFDCERNMHIDAKKTPFKGITHLLKLKNGKILSASKEGTLQIWDDKFISFNNLSKEKINEQHKFNYICQTNDGLIITVENEKIKVWDPIKKKLLYFFVLEFQRPHEEISHILQLKDGKIAVAVKSGPIVFLDLKAREGSRLKVITNVNSNVNDMVQLHNNDLVIFSDNITTLTPSLDIDFENQENFEKQEKIAKDSCCIIL